jgi:hypothetical protein
MKKLTFKRVLGYLIILLILSMFFGLICKQIDPSCLFIYVTLGFFFGILGVIFISLLIGWLLE